MSDGVEWGLHCCTVLALLPSDRALPAARLAEFHGVPAAYLAKHLQALSKAGIVESSQGPQGGYRLTRPADDVTLLEVVLAVDGDEPAFRCTEIRRRGPAAVPARHYSPACAITNAMHQAEEAWRAELASQSIADVLTAMRASVPPVATAKAITWFQEVLA